jgi:hypothetical protein
MCAPPLTGFGVERSRHLRDDRKIARNRRWAGCFCKGRLGGAARTIRVSGFIADLQGSAEIDAGGPIHCRWCRGWADVR